MVFSFIKSAERILRCTICQNRGVSIMAIERQNTFGGLIAIDLFLGGAGAGIFLTSFVLSLLNQFESITRIGVMVGPIWVLAGSMILFFDLGNKNALFRILSNPSSWVARGTYFIILFVFFAFLYFLVSLSKTTMLSTVLGGIAGIFSFLTMLYTGMLFSTMKRVPLWNTPILPLLFIFSSLYAAAAFLILIVPFSTAPPLVEIHLLVMIEIVFILVQLLVLGIFLWTGSYGNTTIAESIRLLKEPLFTIGVISLGLFIPLALLIYYKFMGSGIFFPIMAALLLIIGSLFLRYCIIRAGIRLPLYPV